CSFCRFCLCATAPHELYTLSLHDALPISGADLVATALDDVGRLAPDDPDVTVRRPSGHVTGAEPAVVERLGRGVRAVEVPAEQVLPPDVDLPDRLVVADQDFLALLVDQFEPAPREGRSDVTGAPVPVGPPPAVHDRSAHAVALDAPLSGEPFDPLVLNGGQRRRTGHQQPGFAEGRGD